MIDWKYELAKTRQRALQWFVWKLPRPVIYWCVIRAGAKATAGKYSNQIVPELTLTDTLQRWVEGEA